MDDSAPGKVPDTAVCEPPFPRPEPVRRDRVNDGGHDGAEDDVAVEVAALGNCSGDDGGAGGGEGALTPEKLLFMRFDTKRDQIGTTLT